MLESVCNLNHQLKRSIERIKFAEAPQQIATLADQIIAAKDPVPTPQP